MTGRDLIVYILNNHLEDNSIHDLKDFLKAMTKEEAAVSLGTGLATIDVLAERDAVEGFKLGSELYVLPIDKLTKDCVRMMNISQYGYSSKGNGKNE